MINLRKIKDESSRLAMRKILKKLFFFLILSISFVLAVECENGDDCLKKAEQYYEKIEF